MTDDDVVFQSCERMFHSRSARFTRSHTGEIGQQSEVGNLHASERRKRPRRVWFVAWFLIFVSVFLRGVSACGQSPANVKPTAQPKAMASEHVGSLACAECHKQIYNKYSQTGMGRSMSLVTPEILKAQPTSGSDRKSTRLNSSHLVISYAVFCLKKKRMSLLRLFPVCLTFRLVSLVRYL